MSDSYSKEINKNLLRNKTCENCRYKLVSNSTDWCHIQSYQPSRNTCKNWKAIVKNNY
jgi:hypothetical protein